MQRTADPCTRVQIPARAPFLQNKRKALFVNIAPREDNPYAPDIFQLNKIVLENGRQTNSSTGLNNHFEDFVQQRHCIEYFFVTYGDNLL